ncbi:MAG: DUF6064 family protein [Pseudomonadota bacterium]
MSEWASYELSDFLMFSAATYWRLVERLNTDAWPLQVIAMATGLVLVWMVAAGKKLSVPATGAVLALAWFSVGWNFHWQSFAPINWGARYLAWAFWVQAMLLMGVALRPGPRAAPSVRTRWAGVVVALVAVIIYPAITALIGGSPARAEFAGFMPEPTALATVGLLVATRTTRHGLLLTIPVLSVVIGWTMLRLLHLQ